MSNENTIHKKCAWAEVDIENPSQFSNHEESEESLDTQRKNENAFNKLKKGKPDDSDSSNIQNKGKGGSKLCSWIYNWR